MPSPRPHRRYAAHPSRFTTIIGRSSGKLRVAAVRLPRWIGPGGQGAALEGLGLGLLSRGSGRGFTREVEDAVDGSSVMGGRGWRNALRSVVSTILDAAMPASCVTCGRTGDPICDWCLDTIPDRKSTRLNSSHT